MSAASGLYGRRLAVVLFNLGGPDGPAAVRPFLRNLFADPAIIAAPAVVRLPLAELISRIRERSAVDNYAVMGGGSPIVEETEAQARALQGALARRLPGAEIRVFVAMRYWPPLIDQAARQAAEFAPDDLVLCPLYPQYSTTTTASSLAEWTRRYRGPGRSRTICCWYENDGLIEAHAERIMTTWERAGRPKVRLLFSAHGLPRRVAEGGDPYQWQIEATCAAVAERLGGGWDWRICYQSRVGPLEWIGPSTPEAILATAEEGLGVLIDPVAFVSEHIETLVELDRDYATLAKEAGMEVYLRAPVVGVAERFIDGLAGAVERALVKNGVCPDGAACPEKLSRCGRRQALAA